jgi:hypothetical protein
MTTRNGESLNLDKQPRLNEEQICFMARPFRIEYEGALYHVTSKDD